MELPRGSMLNAPRFGAVRGNRGMFQALLMRRVTSLIAALLGGFGVFCVMYSFAAPDVAAQALMLLGAALAMSYFSTRR
jgi:multisubunit Na+/H+ antiporter MnhB subunit